MNRIVRDEIVAEDGVLRLALPLVSEDAGRSVRVTVEPIGQSEAETEKAWREGILATAGKWQGDFERPPQGEFEVREPLS